MAYRDDKDSLIERRSHLESELEAVNAHLEKLEGQKSPPPWSTLSAKVFLLGVGGVVVALAVAIGAQLVPKQTPSAGSGPGISEPRTAAKRARTISLGPTSGCMTTDAATGLCWGTIRARRSPPRVVGDDARAITVGSRAGCLVTPENIARCWGEADDVHLTSPIADVRAVAVGGSRACVIGGDGQVSCSSKHDPRTPLQGFTNAKQLSISYAHVCAVLANGMVRCDGPKYVVPYDLEPSAEVATGDDFACARTLTGRVRCWGDIAWNKKAEDPGVLDAMKIAAGHERACAIARDGSVSCWTAENTTAKRVNGVTHAKAIAVGQRHVCVVDTNARLWCWSGVEPDGPFGRRPTLQSDFRDVEDVAIGQRDTCVLHKGGAVRCISNEEDGKTTRTETPTELGYELALVEESARYRCYVSQRGLSGCDPHGGGARIELGEDVVQIAAGDVHGCAVKRSGALVCFGDASAGQLGDGTMIDREQPVTVGLTDVVQVAVGARHTCARTKDKALHCWGDGSLGQVGDNAIAIRTTPVGVLGDVEEVALGRTHSCARTHDGTVRCWGSNDYGQLGDGTLSDHSRAVAVAGLSAVTSIVAAADRTCVLRVNGEIQCWGRLHQCKAKGEDTQYCSRQPTKAHPKPEVVGQKGALEIRLGDRHSCARFEGGKLACWGDHSGAQLGARLRDYQETFHGGGGYMETKTREEQWSDELVNVVW